MQKLEILKIKIPVPEAIIKGNIIPGVMESFHDMRSAFDHYIAMIATAALEHNKHKGEAPDATTDSIPD